MTMTIEEVIQQATSRGVSGLPEPSRLTHIRVWPAAPHWIAETGQPPHNDTVGEGTFDTPEEAETAARLHVDQARTLLAAVLPDDLAQTADSWGAPEVTVWKA